MPAQEDQKLVQNFLNGDEQSFNELVRKYQKPIYHTVRRLLGSHEEAEDISQEVFIKAYQKLKDFRGDSAFFTWIYRIAVNVSLNALRKKKIKQMFSLENAGMSIASRNPTPDQEIERDETLQTIQRAIDRLPNKQKIVFTLRYEQRLSHADIAEILNREVGTIKANYHLAIQKLKRAVAS